MIKLNFSSQNLFSKRVSAIFTVCFSALTLLLILGFKAKDMLYAENGARVYVLNNPGGSWVDISKGIPDGASVSSILQHQKKLIIGTYSHGVFTSDIISPDWKSAAGLPRGVRINSLSASGETVIAATHAHGVFISDDAGSSWEAWNKGLTDLNIRSIAVKGGTIYAGTDAAGVFYTTDQANSWQPLNTDLPVGIQVNDLDFRDDNLIVATNIGVYECSKKGLIKLFPDPVSRLYILGYQIMVKDFNGHIKLINGTLGNWQGDQAIYFSKKKESGSGWLLSESPLKPFITKGFRDIMLKHTGNGLPAFYEVLDFEYADGKVFAVIVNYKNRSGC